MTNMAESQYMAKILFRDWIPQAYVDHHHMGSYGARIYLPPYAEPVRPSADPLRLARAELVRRAHGLQGRGGRACPASSTPRSTPAGATSGFHWITPFHNIAGMLTESASARLASPLYIHPDQLQGGTAQPARLRGADDLPESLARRLVAAARHRRAPEDLGVGDARSRGAQSRDGAVERVSQGEAADRARRGGQAEGVRRSPATSTIRSPPTKMVNKLLGQGVEVQRAPKALHRSDGMTYPAGLVRRLDGAAEDGRRPLAARPHVLSRQQLHARPRRRSDPPVRHVHRHDDRVHGRARRIRSTSRSKPSS